MAFKFAVSNTVTARNSPVEMLVEARFEYKGPSDLDRLVEELNGKGGLVEEVNTENQYRCGWKDSNRRHQTQMYPESALVLVK